MREGKTPFGEKGLAELCRQRGISLTRKRKVVIQVIENAKGHPGADEIYAMARKLDPTIGIATVYRTLTLLSTKGVLNRHSFGQEHGHFESHTRAHHDHLVCTSCGKIEEFHISELERMKEDAAEKYGFEMHSHNLEMFGLCSACRKDERRSRRGKKGNG